MVDGVEQLSELGDTHLDDLARTRNLVASRLALGRHRAHDNAKHNEREIAAVGRLPDALGRRIWRDLTLREIARCFLTGAGLTNRVSWRARRGCRVRTPDVETGP